MPASEKREKSMFGVNTDDFRICGLSLGSPGDVWVGQAIGRHQVGKSKGVCGWGAKRKDPGGGLGSKMRPVAYQSYDWGPALLFLWFPSWGHMERTNISTIRRSDGMSPREAGKPPRLQREGSFLLQTEPWRDLSPSPPLLP